MTARFKAVLFDKDGTFFDLDGTWVPFYRDMLQAEMKIGRAAAEDLMSQVGYDVASGKMLSGSILAGGTTRQLVDLWWPTLSGDERQHKARHIDTNYADLALQHLTPLLPLAPVLEQLQDMGYVMGIATNDSQHATKRHVSAQNLGRYISAVFTSDTVPRAKPSGDMVRGFAASAKVDAREIVMVGDNHHDIDEARNGGAGLAVGVLTGSGTREDLEKIADFVIPSIAQLPELLADINSGSPSCFMMR